VIFSGAVMLVGIVLCSRISAIFAVVGSTLGILVSYAIGASTGEATFGLWGYNAGALSRIRKASY
jgi:urea transporter